MICSLCWAPLILLKALNTAAVPLLLDTIAMAMFPVTEKCETGCLPAQREEQKASSACVLIEFRCVNCKVVHTVAVLFD